MQKLLRRFHNLSLSQKMVSAFFALLLVICLVMLAALNISFGIYDQNLYEKSLQSLDFFARQVSDELEDVESFTYDLAVSPELQQQLSELKTLAFGTSAYDYARYQLRVQLIQEARTHPIVKNIRFIDTNGSEMLVGTDTGPMDTASMLEALHQAYGAYLLTSPTADYPYLVGGRDIRKHIDSSMEYLGSCLVTCDAAGVIQRELQGMTSSPGTLYVAAGDTMVYRGAEVAAVGRESGDSEESALLVHKIRHLRGRVVLVLHYEGDDSRVDRAATCAHHDALKRSYAHCCIEALAVNNC